MGVTVIGVSHHSADLAVREPLAFGAEESASAPAALAARLEASGAVILSTCNRVELYANHAVGDEAAAADMAAWLAEWKGVPEDTFRHAIYCHSGRDAAVHLFRVVAGLESMVLGEGEIAGQAKRALDAGRASGSCDKVLNALFQRALSVAKEVRTRTGIGKGRASVASVALRRAHEACDGLEGRSMAVVGAGETAALAVAALAERHPARLAVVCRSGAAGRALAERHGAEWATIDALPDWLVRADAIAVCTAAAAPVIQRTDVERALANRDGRPLCLIDLAVPRNVAPDARGLPGVHLSDLDDLEAEVDAARAARQLGLSAAEEIIERGVEQFWVWHRSLVAEPTLVAIAGAAEDIRQRELARALAALPNLDEETREQVGYLTRRLTKALLHRPMTQLKHEVVHREPHAVLHLVKRLFGVNGHR